MKVRRIIKAAALVTLVLAFVVPVATAAPADALARYVASHQSLDVIGRWLAAHPAATAQSNPVSDVASSLEVERSAFAAQPVPLSDLESSLQVDRRAVASQPAPVSDVSSSLQVARDEAALSVASPKSGSEFAWEDAGVGSAVTLLVIALAAGTTFVRRHRHVTA